MMPRLMSQFSGNQRTFASGELTTTHSWDEATLGAPAEDPEYGAGLPERMLALVPSNRFRYEEKGRITKTTSITEISERRSSLEGGESQDREQSRDLRGSWAGSEVPLRK